MSKSNKNEEIITSENIKSHPDKEWLLQIRGWKLCGTLSFKKPLLDIDNKPVKDFFARYNWHLNGQYSWKNVPVYWKWEQLHNQRIHLHFTMLDCTPEFNWLAGSEASFRNAGDLVVWMKKNWFEGVSHFQLYRDDGWNHYITKPDTLMNSCFTPPVHFLKRKIRAGRIGSFFPWLEPDFYTSGSIANN